MDRSVFEQLHSSLRKVSRLNRVLQMKCYQCSGDLRMLRIIAHHEKEGLTPSLLAQKMEIALPTVSRKLSVLEKQDLIQRAISPRDRRKTFVHATEKGRELLSEDYRRFMNSFTAAGDKLGKEKTQLLNSLLDEFSGYLEEEIQKEAGDVD